MAALPELGQFAYNAWEAFLACDTLADLHYYIGLTGADLMSWEKEAVIQLIKHKNGDRECPQKQQA